MAVELRLMKCSSLSILSEEHPPGEDEFEGVRKPSARGALEETAAPGGLPGDVLRWAWMRTLASRPNPPPSALS